MPSIKTKDVMTLSLLYKSCLAVTCAGLIACGGSGTSRGNSSTIDDGDDDTEMLAINVNVPMYVIDASLEVQIVGQDEPIYSNNNFTGFETGDIEVSVEDTADIVVVTLRANENSQMFDPIKARNTSFSGEIHAIDTIAKNLDINVTPLTEAVYQRTLFRSGNLDFDQPDLSMINVNHMVVSSSELNKVFNQAFSLSEFPRFSNTQSIKNIAYNARDKRPYINSFLSLGMMNLWQTSFPNSENNYVELAQNIGVDLRDGYLDGRSVEGDDTAFLALVNAPKNVDPTKNNLIDIGLRQEDARTTFGEQFKLATLKIALDNNQTIFNPDGVEELEDYSYYQDGRQNTGSSIFRWTGAGDYRPAFGFTTNATCETSIYPCKQGLNADDLNGTYTNNIEYLLGTHQVGSCTVKILASGDVRLNKGTQTITGQINRDLSDNLLRVDDTTQHYILNVGSGEIRPPQFLQFEVKNAAIVSARTGSSQNLYPSLDDLSFDKDDIRSCS